MKRDLGLCRELLLRLEERLDRPMTTYHFGYDDPELLVDGWGPDDISYNLARMLEFGMFTNGSQMDMAGGFLCSGISWEGHDYLDAVRDPEVWKKTKDGAKSVGGLTFGLAKDLALAYLKSEVAAKLGMAL